MDSFPVGGMRVPIDDIGTSWWFFKAFSAVSCLGEISWAADQGMEFRVAAHPVWSLFTIISLKSNHEGECPICQDLSVHGYCQVWMVSVLVGFIGQFTWVHQM